MSLLRLTIIAHHALSRSPLTEVRWVRCESRCQVAGELAALYNYCRRLAGRGPIRRVEILRERIGS